MGILAPAVCCRAQRTAVWEAVEGYDLLSGVRPLDRAIAQRYCFLWGWLLCAGLVAAGHLLEIVVVERFADRRGFLHQRVFALAHDWLPLLLRHGGRQWQR